MSGGTSLEWIPPISEYETVPVADAAHRRIHRRDPPAQRACAWTIPRRGSRRFLQRHGSVLISARESLGGLMNRLASSSDAVPVSQRFF
ncbi:MAG: hypothetical protein R2856_08990 [Caldilineaceae bacterium]